MNNPNAIKRGLLRTAAVVLPAAVLASAVAVAPSFAGAFLTKQEAGATFLKQKEAERTYLAAKTARAEYALKSEVPQIPIVRAVPSTVDVGPIYSTTPFYIPNARAVFQTTSTLTDLVLTFSGQATCVATTSGVGCPIQIMIDGSPTGPPKTDILTSTATSASPQPKEVAFTTVQTGIVTPGKHVIEVRYFGDKDVSLGLKLFDWTLIAEAYPGQEVAPPETEK
jgi:hypothetical protein